MKKVIIIGGGIAGLSAGVYGQKKGYKTTIYESHFLPGGMCTSWRRKGFVFEGCMHFFGMAGIVKQHAFYKMWTELGILPKVKMRNHKIFNTLCDTSGRELNIYTDLNQLRQELLHQSPADEKAINDLCNYSQKCIGVVKAMDKHPIGFIKWLLDLVKAIITLKKYATLTVGDFSKRFEDPLIRSAIESYFVYPDLPVGSLFIMMGTMHMKGFGYPTGSSISVARAVENAYYDLGGTIQYKKRVKRVIIDNGRAIGIELEDGSKNYADIVISAIDGYTTYSQLLNHCYSTSETIKRYKEHPLFNSFAQVSLGVNRDLSHMPHMIKLKLNKPISVAGQEQDIIWFQNYAFDSSTAPEGKSALTILFPSTMAWWSKLGYQSDAYKNEKQEILNRSLEYLEQLLPGITNDVVVTDVATPYTVYRYTGSKNGALGFMLTPNLLNEMSFHPKYQIRGLENFYMTGQWVKGLGVPSAALAGKEVIEKLK